MLVIHGLRKRYGARRVLLGVDLSVSPGEIVGLLGPNGAGKTTVISIVAGLRRADAGSVAVGGIDAFAHPERIRGLIGLTPQHLAIYPVLSVERNLALFGALGGLSGRRLRERVIEVADALDLTELLARRASTLSGGEKRRLNAGMAIVHRPRLVFLDEPTVGADVPTRARVLEMVRALAAAGTAVVYTSHYLAEVEELAAIVAVLDNGRIVARGPVDEIVAAHARAMLRLTFSGAAPTLPDFEVDGEVATLETSDPPRAAAGILPRLGDAAARLRSVDIVRPSLETAYLALTARAANEAGTGGPKEGIDELVA